MIDAMITGNVGSVRYVQAGETSVLNINIATSRKIRDQEYTDWVAGKLWGDRAEKLRSHIGVGTKLLLRGRPEAKGYQKTDGTTGGERILHIREIEFLSPRLKIEQATPSAQLPLEDAQQHSGGKKRRASRSSA